MKNETPKKENKTGRYVYDKALGKIVKVSDEIPGLKKSNDMSSGCPHQHKHNCNGCCGH